MSGVAAVDTVYATLREEILKGTYPPGSHLGEVELARALGVSRTPVREALRRLGADGLIETEPNRGATVRSWDATQLEHLFAVRSVLEGYAAALAAQHASAAERAELAELCDRMEAVARPGKRQDLTLLTTLNEEFHRAVHVASGSALESMGLRYNNPSSYWVQNTSFQNVTYQAYVDGNGFPHGQRARAGAGAQSDPGALGAAYLRQLHAGPAAPEHGGAPGHPGRDHRPRPGLGRGRDAQPCALGPLVHPGDRRPAPAPLTR